MDGSQRFKDLTIQSVSYEALQKEWTMRLYVMGWNGLKTPVAKDDSGEALTEACFDAVTREMGKEAARELYYHVSGSRSEEHTSELQSLMRISYAVFCLKK